MPPCLRVKSPRVPFCGFCDSCGENSGCVGHRSWRFPISELFRLSAISASPREQFPGFGHSSPASFISCLRAPMPSCEITSASLLRLLRVLRLKFLVFRRWPGIGRKAMSEPSDPCFAGGYAGQAVVSYKGEILRPFQFPFCGLCDLSWQKIPCLSAPIWLACKPAAGQVQFPFRVSVTSGEKYGGRGRFWRRPGIWWVAHAGLGIWWGRGPQGVALGYRSSSLWDFFVNATGLTAPSALRDLRVPA